MDRDGGDHLHEVGQLETMMVITGNIWGIYGGYIYGWLIIRVVYEYEWDMISINGYINGYIIYNVRPPFDS